MARVDDPSSKTFFHSDRFFNTNNQWYFSTRETPEKGPFGTQEEANRELNVYLRTEIGLKDIADVWETPGRLR